MTYVYAACTVCVTIFSTGGKFQLVSNFTCSYSSHPFLYNLVIDTSKFLNRYASATYSAVNDQHSTSQLIYRVKNQCFLMYLALNSKQLVSNLLTYFL